MSAAVRAGQLMALGRWRDAAELWRQALAADPADGLAHARLAICLINLDDPVAARREARAAIEHAPDSAFAHWAAGMVALRDDRPGEAEAAAAEALRLDPDDPDHHLLLAAILLRADRAAEALARCEAGLACDPEHAGLVDLRATLLTRLGRRDEAEETIRAALQRDPEDAEQHANLGWARLTAGDHAAAGTHFAEALRLDPDNGYARQGLVESLKARHGIYRLFLAYTLWMAGLSPPTRWLVVILGFAAYRLSRRLAELHPDWAPLLQPVVWAYLAFVFLILVAQPLFDLLLLLHPLGRHALSRRERRAAWAGGLCIAAALAGVIAYPITGHAVCLLAAMAATLLTAVVHDAAEERQPRLRRLLQPAAAILVAVFAAALIFVVQERTFGAMLWQWAMYGWIALIILPPILRARGV